jgi:hypothetical protein
MTAVYPTDAVFNVNNFSVTGSVQYNNTGSTTEFILPTSITGVAQLLPFADGVLQDATTYSLSTFNGVSYSNVIFDSSLYAANLTLKTISVPSYFYVLQSALVTAVLDYNNTVPVTIRGNTYVVNGTRTTFALPLVSNVTSKDAIIIARNGITQSQDTFTFPSSTLNIYGVDLAEAPLAEETVEIRVFDSGTKRYTRKTSMADRKVDRGYSYTRESDVKVNKFIAGYEKRKLFSRRLRRKWNLSYTSISGVEKEAIDNFYIARSGMYEAFSFDLSHLNESGFATVVFDAPPQITNLISGTSYDLTQSYFNVTMVLREVDD